MRAQRAINGNITWFQARKCWRFPYRDPATGERKFINANAGKFEQCGIALEDPGVVRRRTNRSLSLARQLHDLFFQSLQHVVPQTIGAATPSSPR